MRRVIASSAAALMLAASLTAHAATLNGVQGQVLVNRGAGYELASNGMELKPGDVVVINPGGGAHVSYADGCTIPVGVGSVYAVSEASPCGLTTGAADPPPQGLTGTTLAVGAVVVAGGLAAVLLLQKGKDKPSSP